MPPKCQALAFSKKESLNHIALIFNGSTRAKSSIINRLGFHIDQKHKWNKHMNTGPPTDHTLISCVTMNYLWLH